MEKLQNMEAAAILSAVTEFIINWVKGPGLQIVILLVIWIIVHHITRPVIRKIVTAVIKRDSVMTEEDEVKREKTLIVILSGTTKVLIGIFLGLMILAEFGINIGPLIAGAGIVGLAVGFGSQTLVKDVVTGLFIIMENQYRVGDTIKIAGVEGEVVDVSLRRTILRDINEEGKDSLHYVPHNLIKEVSNRR